jgi:hypothetical protein
LKTNFVEIRPIYHSRWEITCSSEREEVDPLPRTELQKITHLEWVIGPNSRKISELAGVLKTAPFPKIGRRFFSETSSLLG